MARIGKIKIAKDFINILDQSLYVVFSMFIPIYIEDRGFDNYKTYFGYCNDFDDIEVGIEPFEYEALITNNNGDYSVEFKRVLTHEPRTTKSPHTLCAINLNT